MGVLREGSPIHEEVWDDPVARHLGTAYHEVGLKYGRRKVSELGKKILI